VLFEGGGSPEGLVARAAKRVSNEAGQPLLGFSFSYFLGANHGGEMAWTSKLPRLKPHVGVGTVT